MPNSYVVDILLKAQDAVSGPAGTAGNALSNLGGVAGGLVAGGMAAGAAAIVGIGAAAFNMANDIDVATDSMTAALGGSAEEAEFFERTMRGVFANNFGNDFDDIAESITTVEQNMRAAGQSIGDDLQSVTEHALAVRDVFQKDVGESTNAAATLMKNFQVTAEEAFDFISAGLQGGLDASGDFLDSIGEYSTQFANAGADAGQFFSALQTGIQGGALGTDKIADSFKEFRLRINDGSDAVRSAALTLFGSTGSIADYGTEIGKTNEKLETLRSQLALAQARQAEFNDKTKESTRLASQQRIDRLTEQIRAQEGALAGLNAEQGTLIGQTAGLIDYEGGVEGFFAALRDGSLTGADAFELVVQGLRNVDDPIQRMQLGTALLGTQFEDLGDSILESVDLGATKLGDLAGATDSLNVKYDNLGAVVEGWKRRALLAITPIGEAMLDLANQKAPIVDEALGAIEASLGALFTGEFGDERIPQAFKVFLQEAIKMRLRWQTDLGGMRTDAERNWIEVRIAAELFWTTLEGIFGQNQDALGADDKDFWQGIYDTAIGWLNDELDDARDILKWLRDAFDTGENLIHGDSEAWATLMGDIFTGLWDFIVNSVKAIFFPDFGEAWQGGLQGIQHDLETWWQGVVTWWRGLSLPSIQFPGIPGGVSLSGYQSGTPYAPGGLALVGERGPELVALPRGSQVYTAQETRSLTRSGGDTYHITNNIYAADPLQAGRAVEETLDVRRRRGYQ